jgi:lipoprotein-anchoring transpeptidase ErfK/SrfK
MGKNPTHHHKPMPVKPKTNKKITVDLAIQTLRAFEGTKIVFEFDCISGDESHPTDVGPHVIIWKDKMHHSKHYDVDMHYALFFTNTGQAIHQYHGPLFDLIRTCKKAVSDKFGSHGCVRLTEGNASALFDWAPTGIPVVII